jgi:DNA polymerase-3 subunit delta'
MKQAQFLPWHLDIARGWLAGRERFAHAWLIHGLAGIGKLEFAQAAAASLLCESPVDGMACGQCLACRWVLAGNHPDLRRIRPEVIALEEGEEQREGDEPEAAAAPAASKRAPSKDIRIDQIRGLESWFHTATHRGGFRVAVLYPAQALTVISANALLKVLEEPPAHTVFLLVADAPDRLLPTLVSRCRRLPLPAPERERALQWLAQQDVKEPESWLAAAGGAPLAALRLAHQNDAACPKWLSQLTAALAQGGQPDVTPLVDTLERVAPAVWIDALQRLYMDLMLAGAGAPVRYFPGLQKSTARAASRADRVKLAEGARWLTRQRAIAGHPLNAKLFVHATLQRVVQSCLP